MGPFMKSREKDPLLLSPIAIFYVVAPLNSMNKIPFVHVQLCGVVGVAAGF